MSGSGGPLDQGERTEGEAAGAPRRRRDAGFSLTETVVTIALLGIVVLPIMSAVITGIRASSASRSAAQVETVIVNAADRVNRAPRSCDYTRYVEAAVRSQQWDRSLGGAVTSYYELSAAGLGQPGQWIDRGCEADVPTPLLVQRVTITVTSPDGRVTRQIEVVKSDV